MGRIKGNTKVTLEKRGTITLRPSDHIATGGEGSLFRAKNTVVKIYTDTKKMARDGMAGKIKLLSAISHKFIISPTGLAFDTHGSPIGFYMPFVSAEPFSRVFTNGFRQREGFSDADASTLIHGMQEAIACAHDNGAILVDANELNWLATVKRGSDPEPRIIDVDSWAIGKWPATVIMPSIKDWHSSHFDELTDWFAWGIVSFQIYTGIHPFKGKLEGFKQGELVKRMKANMSVFTPDVRLNKAVRDFSCIPGQLLDWYIAVFQNGERVEPPSPFDVGVAHATLARVKRTVVTKSGTLIYDKLWDRLDDPVTQVFHCGVALLESGSLINLASKRKIGSVLSRRSEIVSVTGGWLVAGYDNGKSSFSYINGVSLEETHLDLPLDAEGIVRYENRLFLITARGLTEIEFRLIGKPILSTGRTWGAMVNSTHFFDGVGIQDEMGATYLIAPFGDNACAQVRVRELDGFRPIAAKAGNRFITVLAVEKTGAYRKFEFTFSKNYDTYTVWDGETDSGDLNIAILPKGICATIVNDCELDIFVPTSGTLNKVKDKNISTDMVLANWKDKVLYVQDGSVWHVHLR